MPSRLLWSLEYVVENGLKLLGIVAWTHYLGLTSFSAVRQAMEHRMAAENGSQSFDYVGERAEVR